MPNGDPLFHLNELPALERFFAPLADVLTAFGRQHNMKLEKYYHQFPAWSFAFRHPGGGVGQIEVRRDSDSTLSILATWWYDDFDTLTRFIKNADHVSLPPDPPLLNGKLESLTLILSWQAGKWDECSSGNASWKRNWTKAEFDALVEAYPCVRLRGDSLT